MTLAFNADEVFEMAEEIERNGASFYRRMAECLDEGRSRSLLESLSREEAEHVRRFQDLRQGFTEDGTGLDPDPVTVLYLRALADGRVFDPREAEKDLGRCPDPLTILQFAIQREKDSIVYYMGMKELVPPEMGQKAIDAILHEEMQHVTQLSEEVLRIRKEG